MIVKKILIAFAMLFQCSVLIGQDLVSGSKTWLNYELVCSINKKNSTSLSQLYSVENKDGDLSFIQTNLSYEYKISSNKRLSIGVANYLFKWSPRYEIYNVKANEWGMVNFYSPRVEFGLDKRLTFLKIKNSLEAQVFFPQLLKFRYRIIYTLKAYYKNNKWPLKLTPFVEGNIGYYLDGKRHVYLNPGGGIDHYSAPNGLHRLRLKMGFNFRPFGKRIIASPYVMNQWEFNGNLNKNHRLNYKSVAPKKSEIINRVEIINPFNNYLVFGLYMQYKLLK